MPIHSGALEIEKMLGDIFHELRGSKALRTIACGITADEIHQMMSADYGRHLRSAFSRNELLELIAGGRRLVWPQLNIRSFQTGPPEEFARRWLSTGVEFRFANFTSPDGFPLMGFYAGIKTGLKRPLICVNTAHHGVAVSSAFAHEMGHHVVTEVFDRGGEGAHLMSLTGFSDHLEDTPELAADVIVSVGIFPRNAAKKCFGPDEAGSDRSRCVIRGVQHIIRSYGFRLDRGISPEKRLHYLAGLVHYTKLRIALLDEYNL